MNWTQHPNLYQLSHWWHWLTYGSAGNAFAVQAIAAVLGVIAASVAAFFAVKAYLSTVVQLTLARSQLKLQEKQFEQERLRHDEERAANKRAARARFERLKSEEDAGRPRFQVGSRSEAQIQSLDFTNTGALDAYDVSVSSAISSGNPTHFDLIRSGRSLRGTFDLNAIRAVGIAIRFKTQFGSTWTIKLQMRSDGRWDETIISVDRPYDDLLAD